MSSDTAAEYLIKKIRKQQVLVTGSIIGGTLDQFEYKRLCGMLNAFDYCIELIDHTAKQVENEEELTDDE